MATLSLNLTDYSTASCELADRMMRDEEEKTDNSSGGSSFIGRHCRRLDSCELVETHCVH